jgi:Na+-driven multidrug efflux pump
MVVVLGGLVLFAPQAMALFSDDPATLSAGVRIIRILSLGYLAFALTWVYDSAQGGAGDTVPPMVINIVALLLIQIPLAVLLPQISDLGADGVWVAVVIGWFVQAALMVWRYRQGRWKLKQI